MVAPTYVVSDCTAWRLTTKGHKSGTTKQFFEQNALSKLFWQSLDKLNVMAGSHVRQTGFPGKTNGKPYPGIGSRKEAGHSSPPPKLLSHPCATIATSPGFGGCEWTMHASLSVWRSHHDRDRKALHVIARMGVVDLDHIEQAAFANVSPHGKMSNERLARSEHRFQADNTSGVTRPIYVIAVMTYMLSNSAW